MTCRGFGGFICTTCEGHGSEPDDPDDQCLTCRGHGTMNCARCRGDGGVPCPDCAGSRDFGFR